MRQRSRIGFPVLSVKSVDRDIKRHPIIDAPIRHRETVLIRPRHVKTLHAARFAKSMLRAARVERVLAHCVRALQEAKPRRRHNHVNIPTHRADGAIAILSFKGGRQVDFKTHCAAMASALMGDEIGHDHLLTFLHSRYAIAR